MTEQEKYTKAWSMGCYRLVAPGEQIAPLFAQMAQPTEVIDFGAGTGRGAMMLAMFGAKVHMLDFARNCLDAQVRDLVDAGRMTFTEHDLTQPAPITAPFGFCTDVMEHIPREDVDRVLTNILDAAGRVMFQISCEEDRMGALVGAPLHLTVEPHDWWRDKLISLGARVLWSEDCTTHALLYVTKGR